MATKKKRILLVVVVALVVIAAKGLWYLAGDEPQPAATPPQSEHSIPLARGFGDARALAADATGIYIGMPRMVVRVDRATREVEQVTQGFAYDLKDLALDGESVIIAAGPQILAAPVDGGAAEILFEDPQAPEALAVVGERIYTAGSKGLLVSVSRAPPKLVHLGNVSDVTADATAAYWTTWSEVMRKPHGDGQSQILAHEPFPISVAVDATHVYWTVKGTFSSHMEVYYRDGSVWRVAMTGGTPELLASKQAMPYDVLATSTRLLWWNCDCHLSDAPESGIVAAPRTGGTSTRLVGPAPRVHLANFGDAIFFTSDGVLAELR